MKCEIERRFLVPCPDAIPGWDDIPAEAYRQAYLHSDPGCTVRVRLAGARAWLTIKGPTRGAARDEFEYPISPEDAARLCALARSGSVVKTRRVVRHAGMVWEVDVFGGANVGLVLAEVELESADQSVELPPWVGAEVTEDSRYSNARLARVPWGSWGEAGGKVEEE